MSVRIEVAEDVDRPVAEVFEFYADDHVKNHPRWDPDIELWLDEDVPMGVGTVIRRRNSRSGSPVEGTMEVVEYEPNHSFAVLTRDGDMEMWGRATFHDLGDGRTRLNLVVDMPIDETMKEHIAGLLQGSLQRIKQILGGEG